jgi:hypothetical protein
MSTPPSFNNFLKNRISFLKANAKKKNITLKDYIKTIYGQTMSEYKSYHRSLYNRKECHSFWESKCMYKNIECYHCTHYYSMEDLFENDVSAQRKAKIESLGINEQ